MIQNLERLRRENNALKALVADKELELRIKDAMLKNDNGAQFEAGMVQQYFADKNITQEFTKPATPEQNAHIESYHSIIESVI